MESSKRRVAVIGAGASGLAAAKICLEQGMEPVCLERNHEVGGLWNYSDAVQEGYSTVMKTTVSNTCKEMSAFSDFLMPEHYPNLMPHSYVFQYFKLYASNFDLTRHIRFNVEVTAIRRTDDYAGTGKWVVESRSRDSKDLTVETFDAVLVCSGLHRDKNMPRLPGMEKFKGRVLHVHDYRPNRSYDDKAILVVGMGNSAGDAAVELSRQAKQVYLSTRRGCWVSHLYTTKGFPADACFLTRFEHWQNTALPAFWTKARFAAVTNQALDHDLYCMTPETGHAPFYNDEIVGRIACGSIEVKGDVMQFTDRGVKFMDGTYRDIDVVVLATGYLIGFPFVDKEVLDVRDNKVNLYKQVFSPHLSHPTLAFIGLFHPNGCTWPISELQSRLATAVFDGKIKLPSQAAMQKDIEMQQAKRTSRFPDTPRHTIEVDYMEVMEELAEIVGCKPNIGRLLFSDPWLAFCMFFWPCIPAQYRLEGPGRWDGARQAILQTQERIRYPLQTRTLPPNRSRKMAKMAEWILYPPALWTAFLEVLVVVLLLVMMFA